MLLIDCCSTLLSCRLFIIVSGVPLTIVSHQVCIKTLPYFVIRTLLQGYTEVATGFVCIFAEKTFHTSQY